MVEIGGVDGFLTLLNVGFQIMSGRGSSFHPIPKSENSLDPQLILGADGLRNWLSIQSGALG